MNYLDHVSIGIVRTDENLVVGFWNSRMEDWTGISRDQALGQNLQELYPHFAEETYLSRIRLLLEGGAPLIFSYQLHGCLFPRRSGETDSRVQHVVVTRDKDSSGSTVLFFSVEDRTEVSLRIRAARAALGKVEFLMRELNHRVKNNLNMILSLIALQRGKSKLKAVINGLNDLEGRIHSFAALHEALYLGKDGEWISADEYLRTVTTDLLNSILRPGFHLDFQFQVEPIRLNPKAALYTGLMAVEAITNAVKYGLAKRAEGHILLSLTRGEGSAVVFLTEDDGPGFGPRKKPLKGETLGIRIISILAEELKGSAAFTNARDGLGGARVVVGFNTDTGPN